MGFWDTSAHGFCLDGISCIKVQAYSPLMIAHRLLRGSSESEAANPRGRRLRRDGRNRRTTGERHHGLHIYDCL